MCSDTKDMAVGVWQQVLFQRDKAGYDKILNGGKR